LEWLDNYLKLLNISVSFERYFEKKAFYLDTC